MKLSDKRKRLLSLSVLIAAVFLAICLNTYQKGYGLYLDENYMPKVEKFDKSPVKRYLVDDQVAYCIETWDDYLQINRNWLIKPINLIEYENEYSRY